MWDGSSDRVAEKRISVATSELLLSTFSDDFNLEQPSSETRLRRHGSGRTFCAGFDAVGRFSLARLNFEQIWWGKHQIK